MRHPRLLHRIWLGPNSPLDRDVDFTERWKALHPGWSMMVWDDQAVEDHLRPMVLDQLYDSAPTYVHRADLIAIEAVYRMGGVLAGWDMEPVRNLESLIEDSDGWCTPDADGYPGGGLFGAREGHPALQALIATIADGIASKGWTQPNRDTGPYAWNSAIGPTGRMPNGLDILGSPLTAYPIHWRIKGLLDDDRFMAELRGTPEVYAIHHFNGSWLPGGLDVKVR